MSLAAVYVTVALALTGALGLCLVGTMRGSLLARLAALEMAGVVAVLATTVLAVASHRPSYLVVPLALAAVAAPGALIFAHVIERWLDGAT